MQRLKVVSGGQTGADQGGLYAARVLGIPTGGYAPYGWITDTGPAPWLEEYGLVEMGVGNEYRQRTIKNVWSANAVLWFGNPNSPGGKLTLRTAREAGVPRWLCNFQNRLANLDSDVREVAAWLKTLPPVDEFVLMVAGNRERKAPGIRERTQDYMNELLHLLLEDK